MIENLGADYVASSSILDRTVICLIDIVLFLVRLVSLLFVMFLQLFNHLAEVGRVELSLLLPLLLVLHPFALYRRFIFFIFFQNVFHLLLYLLVATKLATTDQRYHHRQNHFMTDVTQRCQHSDPFDIFVSVFQLLTEPGDQFLTDQIFIDGAQIVHDQFGERVDAVAGIDASLIYQSRYGQR